MLVIHEIRVLRKRACALWLGAGKRPPARPGSSYGSGSRAPSIGGGGSAGMYVSA